MPQSSGSHAACNLNLSPNLWFAKIFNNGKHGGIYLSIVPGHCDVAVLEVDFILSQLLQVAVLLFSYNSTVTAKGHLSAMHAELHDHKQTLGDAGT